MKPTDESFEEAILQLRHLERVTIEIDGQGFVWRLVGDGGKEVVAAEGDSSQVPDMLQATEVLLNTEMGIRTSKLVCIGLN